MNAEITKLKIAALEAAMKLETSFELVIKRAEEIFIFLSKP